jgi:L-rhamnose-H+ transport protein
MGEYLAYLQRRLVGCASLDACVEHGASPLSGVCRTFRLTGCHAHLVRSRVGIAQVLFGISIQRLGLGLAYAIVVGLGTLLGTLVPLCVQHRTLLDRPLLIEVLSGIAMMLVGIALSAWAGQIREHGLKSAETSTSARYGAAVLVAVLCGILAPMLNYSFAFGQDIAHAAVRLGNPEVRAAYAVWPIGLAGGLLPNVGYSIFLIPRGIVEIGSVLPREK